MAKVYTSRLLSGALVSTVTATVPDGVLWVVRDMRLFWDGESDPTVEFYSVTVAAQPLIFTYGVVGSSGPHMVVQEELRQVVLAGETLEFGATTEHWYVAITGYVLTLP